MSTYVVGLAMPFIKRQNPPVSLSPSQASNRHKSKRSLPLADFSHRKLKHLVRLHRVFVHELTGSLNPGNRHSVLYLFSRLRRSAIWEGIRKREELGEKPQLSQDGALIPANVFMEQSIAADVYDAGERNAQRFAGWWNAGEPERGQHRAGAFSLSLRTLTASR